MTNSGHRNARTCTKNICTFLRRKEIPALNGVSLRVERGTIFGLDRDQNGAGKTTLLKILLGLSRFDRADPRVCSEARRATTKVRRKIGYLPEQMRCRNTFSQEFLPEIYGAAERREAYTLKKRIPEIVGASWTGRREEARQVLFQRDAATPWVGAGALLNDPELLISGRADRRP